MKRMGSVLCASDIVKFRQSILSWQTKCTKLRNIDGNSKGNENAEGRIYEKMVEEEEVKLESHMT